MNLWRKESIVNEVLFLEYEESWIISGASQEWVKSSKKVVWDNLETAIHRSYTEPKKEKKARRKYIMLLSAVASIAFLFGIFLPQFRSTNEGHITTIKTPKGQKAEVSLPDGSIAILNSQSSISYNLYYGEKHREIKMEGEVFFDVAQKEEHAFNLYANDMKVEVLGTAFLVNAYQNADMLSVALLRGKVKVNSQIANCDLTLQPNQRIIIDKNLKSYSIVDCNAETEVLWTQGQLKVIDLSMKELIGRMEHWYGVNISFEGDYGESRYWMTIKTESLTEMLELINKITPIRYSIQGEEVRIKYR